MEENYRALANAIIVQAVKDLRAALRRKKRLPDDGSSEKNIREITGFFCSQYFQTLSDLDGPALANKIIMMEGGDAG